MKYCWGCKTEKPIEKFYKNKRNKDGLKSRCKACILIEAQKAPETPDRIRKKSGWWKQYGCSFDMKRRYGIDKAQYDAMLEQQKGLCAICGVALGFERKKICIDHNHATDQVRQLLCHSCNFSLGGFKDSIEVCEAAVSYLRKWAA
jgi:hypothetical protein